jgi:cell volume regulation protein A
VVRLLEAEAGFNDPVAIALTVALVAAAGSGHIEASSIIWTTAREALLGAVVGLVAGLLAARVLGPRWPTLAMAPPLAVLAGAFATFGLGALAHGSGFVAVYLYGLVLGDDADLPQADAVRAFGEQLSSLAEIAMFVLLGVALAQVPLRHALFDAALLTVALVVVVRPLLVYPALRALRRTHGEAVFATVGGLKGAVPILLAALPLQAHLAGSDRLFALAGLVVLASLAFQGPAVAWMAPRLSAP